MFLELNRAIREEVVTLLFHAEVTAGRGHAAQLHANANGGGGPLTYEHESLAGADAILAAGGGTSTAAAAGFASGGGVATTPVAQKPKVNSEYGECRPQRPLLVRLGQEVQEVPRRLEACR